MENKNPIFSIKNFRSFGEEGADFELAPITVLTGCNSAGKSSLVKALLLLSRQIMNNNETKHINTGEVRFYQEPNISVDGRLELASNNLDLGGFESIIHKDERSNGEIEISYVIFSFFMQENIRIRRIYNSKDDIYGKWLDNGDNQISFCADRTNYNDDGVCKHIIIEKENGTLIFDTNNKKHFKYNKCNNETNCHIIPDFEALSESYKRFEAGYKQFIDNGEESGNKSLDDNMGVRAEKMSLRLIPKDTREAYEIWCDLHKKNLIEFKDFYQKVPLTMINDNIQDGDRTILMEMDLYFQLIYQESLYPFFINDTGYVSSESATVKRFYQLRDDDKMSKALYNAYIKSSDIPRMFRCENRPFQFCNKWFREFGIGKGVVPKIDSEKQLLFLYLVKGRTTECIAESRMPQQYERLLADEGYGVTQLASLLLNIELFIPDRTESHIVPRYICVEEPEIHLHPKYQSLLADMFVEAYQKYNIHFIIETHSEYLIRKLQVMVADKENKLSPNDVSINYVEKDDTGTSHNRQIKILDDGSLDGKFGTGFFDEAASLAVTLFKSKNVLS